MQALADQEVADLRSASRASLYLAAALYCDGAPRSVKIRNISSNGALVEGVALPDEGSMIQLVRGGLIVHGLVAWLAHGRCGLKFSGSIDVREWRAAPAHAQQARVDEVVRLVKAGALPLPVAALDGRPPNEDHDQDGERADDHQRAIRLLEGLGNALASDLGIVARHATVLQNLDIATQVITVLEAIQRGDSDPEINATKLLTTLRTSADQALRPPGDQ